jgi:threonine dehydrogenase-like Zn-dependent dehydrogenase
MTDERTAVVTGPGRLDIVPQATDDPAPGEIQVAVAGCGICGSDAPVWEGRPWFEYPLAAGAPGHEAWGTVEASQEDVRGLGVGTPVALLTTRGLTTRINVPLDEVVPLPAELTGAPFPGEALACVFNVARRSGFQPGDTVAIIGIGFLGAVVAQLAVRSGARVIAIARREEALQTARSLGVSETVLMDDHQRVIDAVAALTAGRMCATVVEATGAQWPLDLAAELIAVSGRLVVAGYHQDGTRSVNMQLWNWRGIDVVNAHERDPGRVRFGLREAAAAVADGWFDPSSLYSHVYPLAQASLAMDALVTRPAGFTKALVTM